MHYLRKKHHWKYQSIKRCPDPLAWYGEGQEFQRSLDQQYQGNIADLRRDLRVGLAPYRLPA